MWGVLEIGRSAPRNNYRRFAFSFLSRVALIIVAPLRYRPNTSIHSQVQFQLVDAQTRATSPPPPAITTTLTQVSTLNDLRGINLFSSSEFRDVLSAVSKRSSTYYPSMARITVLANLPKLLQGVVKLFTPIFPKAVRDKLKFVTVDVPPLKEIRGGDFLGSVEEKFLV